MIDEMDDWWAEFKRQEEERQQFEEEINKLRQEIASMKVTVHDNFSAVSGTSLQGRIAAGYDELVRAFGKPLQGDMYKTRAEWVVEFEMESTGEIIVATVYDWKQYDCEVEDVKSWNIGGYDFTAAQLVTDYLNYIHDMNEQAAAHEAEQDAA